MLLSLLLAACGLDDPAVGDGADPLACNCDPVDSTPAVDSATPPTDSGCVDTDTTDTTDPCSDTGATTGR